MEFISFSPLFSFFFFFFFFFPFYFLVSSSESGSNFEFLSLLCEELLLSRLLLGNDFDEDRMGNRMLEI